MVFKNVNHDENQSNNTNDKIRIKKIMTKIVNDLDENLCKNHLLKSIYVYILRIIY